MGEHSLVAALSGHGLHLDLPLQGHAEGEHMILALAGCQLLAVDLQGDGGLVAVDLYSDGLLCPLLEAL